MDKPTIEVIPERAGARSDGETTMRVLVRITPPRAQAPGERPALNIGLVIDRSGSMEGAKLRAAKNAARYAVNQLASGDRVSVTIFDSAVETIAPSALAGGGRERALRAIERIECGGSTALHAGWVEGATQVASHLEARALNRVLLLTDGQANVGEVRPESICSDVAGLRARGVSTSALGVGDDYNEDLLAAMALSGDGGYHDISEASALERVFAEELRGLMSTTGRTVSLGLEPQRGAEVKDVLNDLERNRLGRLQLPNFLDGAPINIVLTLTIPAQDEGREEGRERDACLFRLAWDSPGASGRQVMRAALCLRAVASDRWESLPRDERVQAEAGRLEVSRARQRAAAEMDRGDLAAARAHLGAASQIAMALPAPMAAAERRDLDILEQSLDDGRVARASKAAKEQSFKRSRSR